MRKLTVKRIKGFYGYLVCARIYIEDPLNGDTVINNTVCSLVGKVKNGEEKTFDIPCESRKLFVVVHKFERNLSNELYILPEGEEDIVVEGKITEGIFAGSPFKIKGNNSPEAIANRKKGQKRGAAVLITAVIVGWIIGNIIGFVIASNALKDLMPQKKEFSANGVTITLTDDFYESDEYKNEEGYEETGVFEDDYTVIFIDKYVFEGLHEFAGISLEDYTEYISGMVTDGQWPEIKKEDGFMYFEFEYDDRYNGVKYSYYGIIAVYRQNTEYVVVEISTMLENKESFRDDYLEYIRSVKFIEKE